MPAFDIGHSWSAPIPLSIGDTVQNVGLNHVYLCAAGDISLDNALQLGTTDSVKINVPTVVVGATRAKSTASRIVVAKGLHLPNAGNGTDPVARSIATEARTAANSAQRAAGLTPMDFGAVGDGVANDAAALQAWIDSGGDLTLVGSYRYNVPLTVAVDGTNITGTGTLTWGGPIREAAGVILTGGRVRMRGVKLGGNDFLARGVQILGGDCDVEGCEISAMRSFSSTAVGVVANALIGGKIANNHIHHIHSAGDATVGNANGASRAVLIQASADLIKPYDVIENDIHDITGEEGDGIHILLLSGTVFRSAAKTRIARNRIRASGKRCIKVQAHDVLVDGNIARLDVAGAYSAIDIINSNGVSVTGNDVTVTVTNGRGIQYASFDVPTFGRCANGVLDRNRVNAPAGAAHIALYALMVDGISVSSNTVTHGQIIVEDCVAPVTNSNVGIDMVLAGSDGLVSVRLNCVGATANWNVLQSGGGYTCVRIDAPGTMATGNRNLSVTHDSTSAVFVTSASNVLTGNINAKPAVPAIRYGGGATEAGQVLAAQNLTM